MSDADKHGLIIGMLCIVLWCVGCLVGACVMEGSANSQLNKGTFSVETNTTIYKNETNVTLKWR